MSFSPQDDASSLLWFIFTTGHYKIKIHRSAIFQFSAGTESSKWRWNHPRDQGKQLILLSVSSCNSWRVHFFLFSFSVLKIINKTLLITEHLVISWSINVHVCIIQLNLNWYLLFIYYCKIAAESNSTITYFKNQPQQGERQHKTPLHKDNETI